MSTLGIGSVCTGYAGLDGAVQAVFGGELVWVADPDPGAAAILAHHHPDVPNLHDITTVDWTKVEPVEVLTAGYPCQPFSAAGRRRGKNDPRHLWPYIAVAIGRLRPKLIVLENVRGHLTLGFDQVVRDLDWLGYSVTWTVLGARDVGAPHQRYRIFVLGVERGLKLCSGTRGWRGVHRHQVDGHLVRSASQGWDDGQGGGLPGPLGGDVRWQGDALPAEAREEPQSHGVASERAGGGRVPETHPTAHDHKSEGCGHRHFASGHGGCGAATAERPGDLGRGDAQEGGDPPASDPGTEPRRPGPCATSSSGREETPSGTPLGCLVGAGRESVRADRVHGLMADLRNDDRGTRVCGLGPSAPGHLATAAHPADHGHQRGRPAWGRRPGLADGGIAVADADRGGQRQDQRDVQPRESDAGRSAAADAQGARRQGPGSEPSGGGPERGDRSGDVQWGAYGPAIRRWEAILGRPAPRPTEPGANGQPRLTPVFTEWLMGLPAGHVTDVPGLSRNAQLKALGNGVVPQQAAAALVHLMERRAAA